MFVMSAKAIIGFTTYSPYIARMPDVCPSFCLSVSACTELQSRP